MENQQFDLLEEKIAALLETLKRTKSEKEELALKLEALEGEINSLGERNRSLEESAGEAEQLKDEIGRLKEEREQVKGKVSILIERIEGIEKDFS